MKWGKTGKEYLMPLHYMHFLQLNKRQKKNQAHQSLHSLHIEIYADNARSATCKTNCIGCNLLNLMNKHRCSQKPVLTWNIRYGILEKANTDQCFFESEMKHIVHSFRYQMPPGDQ